MSQTQTSPPDVMDQDPVQDEKKIKSRRPPNTAFRQQRLKAWQPILTPKTVLPLFFAVGIIFAPLGGLMLWASSEVQELMINYSECSSLPLNQRTPVNHSQITSVFQRSNDNALDAYFEHTMRNYSFGVNSGYTHPVDTCTIEFNIPNTMEAPVFLYYRLTKFYQNHRRYVQSVNQDQLNGKFVDNATIAKSSSGTGCQPLDIDHAVNKSYYPCGLIANSMFNDTYSSPVLLDVSGGSNANNMTYDMSTSNVAWASDAALYGKTAYTNDQVVPPRNWRVQYPLGVYNDQFPIPDIHTWDAFQVWMRTAGLPTFSKLAMRNDTAAMQPGTYSIDIMDAFPVTEYDGTKSILLSTRTVLGGKNPFLGIAYVVIGGVCIVLGAIFTVTHLIKPRKLGDHTYLSWNNDQPSAATVATGRSLRPNDA